MKAFNRVFTVVVIAIILLFVVVNMILAAGKTDGSRQYRVEISRLAREIETNGSADISECEYVTNIERYGEKFYTSDSDYIIYEINGELYRFDYNSDGYTNKTYLMGGINAVLGVIAILFTAVLLYIKYAILAPFERLSSLPYELSKGNLTTPIKESKNRFFGKFLWGIDILRENIEQQKQRELEMQKEKKTLLLSLSHDIKTPLSAIKLYSAALSKNLYPDAETQHKIAENINEKADEIERYVSQIVTASREDFLSLEVNMGEFYLSELVEKIRNTAIQSAQTDTQQAVSAAVGDELNRLKSIDEIAGKIADKALVERAKYGEEKMSAADLALEALKSQNDAGQAFLNNMKEDAKSSGAEAIAPAPNSNLSAEEQAQKDIMDGAALIAGIAPETKQRREV